MGLSRRTKISISIRHSFAPFLPSCSVVLHLHVQLTRMVRSKSDATEGMVKFPLGNNLFACVKTWRKITKIHLARYTAKTVKGQNVLVPSQRKTVLDKKEFDRLLHIQPKLYREYEKQTKTVIGPAASDTQTTNRSKERSTTSSCPLPPTPALPSASISQPSLPHTPQPTKRKAVGGAHGKEVLELKETSNQQKQQQQQQQEQGLSQQQQEPLKTKKKRQRKQKDISQPSPPPTIPLQQQQQQPDAATKAEIATDVEAAAAGAAASTAETLAPMISPTIGFDAIQNYFTTSYDPLQNGYYYHQPDINSEVMGVQCTTTPFPPYNLEQTLFQ